MPQLVGITLELIFETYSDAGLEFSNDVSNQIINNAKGWAEDDAARAYQLVSLMKINKTLPVMEDKIENVLNKVKLKLGE